MEKQANEIASWGDNVYVKIAITNSNGEILKTNYYYHNGNSIHTQNRISEIEKTRNF